VSDRHAPPDEACKLIKNFAQAEIEMIRSVEAHTAGCGIPQTIADQLRNGHKNTEAQQMRVCAVARQSQERCIGDERGRLRERSPIGDFPPYLH
jgi:hypothetical protein